MYKRNAQGWSKHFDFFIIDEISLQLAFLLATSIRQNSFAYALPIYRALGVSLVLIDALVLMMFNPLHNVLSRGYYLEFAATLKHCFFVFASTSLYMFSTQSGTAYSRIILFLTFAFHVVLGYGTRILWKLYVTQHAKNKNNKRTMLAVLDAETGEAMLQRLLSASVEGYQIVGVVLNGENDRKEINGVPVVAGLDQAASYIVREWVDSVYVDCPATDPKIEKLMDDCCQMGVPVHYHVQSMSRSGIKRFAEKVGGTTVLTTSINYATPVQAMVKRLFDICGGIIGSALALLIMLIVGPIIKWKSPGPILYSQVRIGKNGKRFKMYKIRSMYMDADERKKDLMAQNRVKNGMMFKLDFDPRIIGNELLPDGTKKTGIGEFIRKTSLDEFPQFFNVLMGQMSLVGTRPPTVDEWEKYELHHRARLAIKPGITGMWQVSGRSDITDFEEVVRLDTQYIYNWNYGLDIKILLKTIASVFKGKGAM